MVAILSEADVVGGVLAAVNDDGPIPPTARRLAARLHVAPATLYSAVPAMGRAYSQARTDLVAKATGALVDAFARGDSERLAGDIVSRPNEFLFMTDPSVELRMNPMVERAMARIGIDDVAMGDLLALVGSTFDRRDSDAPQQLAPRIDAVVAWYKGSLLGDARAAVAAPSASPQPELATILALAKDVPKVDPGRPSRTGADADAARRASAAIVMQADGVQWSFRELSRMTSIPVTRLHRYGSRSDHLARAAAELLTASSDWAAATASDSDRVRTTVSAVVQTHLRDVLIELYRSSRATGPDDQAVSFDVVLSNVLSPGAVAIMAARSARGDTTETVTHITSAVAHSDAA